MKLSPWERSKKYGPCKGLEGPYWFGDRVLYFDPIEQLHYDSTTDYYVSADEMDVLHQKLLSLLSQ